MFNPLINLKKKLSDIKDAVNNTNKNKNQLLIIGNNLIDDGDIDKCTDMKQLLIQHCETYTNALLLITKNHYDLIFIDFEIENVELVNAIRRLDSNSYRTPLIAVSIPKEQGEILTILSNGFDDYLVKPVKHKNLEAILDRWLNNIALRINQSSSASLLKGKSTKKTHLPEPDSLLANPENNKTSGSIKKTIDIEASLKYSHQNNKLARDLLLILITSLKSEKNKALSFYRKNKWVEIGALAHKLYGGSCYCGVPNLQDKTKATEKAVDENDIKKVKLIFPELIAAMDDLLLWHETYDIDVIFNIE
jgi:two-component system sensor histidine kinase BarA